MIVAVGRDDIGHCLGSLLDQTLSRDRYEVILVADRPLDVEPGDNIVTVATESADPSTKRNAGARVSRGRILAFIDDDARARRDWLENGLAFMLSYPGAAGVGGPRVLPEGASFLQKATDIIAHSAFFGNGHGNWQEMQIQNKVPHGMINSCNYFIRRDIFLELGGYNEAIGYGGEDTEFIYQAVTEGGCLFAYTWDLIVYHPPRRFGWDLIKQRFRYRVQNGKMLWVHPGLYLSRWTFSIGLFGITAFIIASLLEPVVLPVGLGLYFLVAFLVSLSYTRYDLRFIFVLPAVFFIHHVIYYLAIWKGILTGVVNHSSIREIKNFRK
ncbi:MAG: glycosyltransferase family 2 protein [Candidatus Tritonobacter lacicola]|nr:glycosyltransferase family 2 protein [Candidatus Tritonobacter lacicola]